MIWKTVKDSVQVVQRTKHVPQNVVGTFFSTNHQNWKTKNLLKNYYNRSKKIVSCSNQPSCLKKPNKFFVLLFYGSLKNKNFWTINDCIIFEDNL